MKRTIIFIDANNWYHNIKRWFKPSLIDMKKISQVIAKEKNLDIIEIRWYTSVPNIEDNKQVYLAHMDFLGYLERQGIKVIARKLQRLSNKEIIKKREDLLESWDLCEVCKPLVEVGFTYIQEPNQKEKGVDVRIAIDMVKEALQNKLDYCVLISGDADFIPALELIKGLGKEVLSSFVTRGYSNELRQKFQYRILSRGDLNKCLKDYNKEKV